MGTEIKFPVRLTEPEVRLLSAIANTPPAIAALLGVAAPKGRELPLTLDEIDNLVERLRDEVVDSGFDADYALNERGRILDGLADRLFSRFLMSRPDQG